MKFKLAVLLLASAFSSSIHAGPFADELSKCLVRSTSESDKTALMRWVFAAMAAHPEVKALSNITEKQGDELNKEASGLFVELLTSRCKGETEQALKFEGTETFKRSFQVLGEVAMQGLIANPEVTRFMGGLDRHLDTRALEKAFGKRSLQGKGR